MKLAGIILILFSCGLYIWNLFDSCTKRISVLKKFLSDAEIMKNEIFFKHTPLAELFALLSDDGISGEFYRRISLALNEGEYPEAALKEGFSTAEKYITEEDREIFFSFFKLLGTTDDEGQKRAFESFEAGLSSALSDAVFFKKEKLKPKCAMISFVFITAVILVL